MNFSPSVLTDHVYRCSVHTTRTDGREHLPCPVNAVGIKLAGSSRVLSQPSKRDSAMLGDSKRPPPMTQRLCSLLYSLHSTVIRMRVQSVRRTPERSMLLTVGDCTSGMPASRSPLMSRSSAIASSRNRCLICSATTHITTFQ